MLRSLTSSWRALRQRRRLDVLDVLPEGSMRSSGSDAAEQEDAAATPRG